jgi:hypothetical protein
MALICTTNTFLFNTPEKKTDQASWWLTWKWTCRINFQRPIIINATVARKSWPTTECAVLHLET